MKAINQKQEHTGSWYAASVNEVTRYPELQGRRTADICIVGAGFTGTAAALNLVERGYSVALLEANRVGWGASGRNGGQLINGISGLAKVRKRHGEGVADMLWDLKWRGHTIIYDWVDKYGIACDLREGFVEAALKPRHLADVEDYADDLEAHDFPYRYEVWDREKIRAMLGTDAFVGGLVNFRDGHLHPLNLCIGEARAASDMGVQVFEQSPVTHIEHAEKPVVVTAGGSIQADAVVLAGNAYHNLEPGTLANLCFPAGSYIIATESLSEDLANQINPLDVAVCDLNEVMDYYRLSADRRMLYGGRCNYSGRDPSSIKAAILPRMLKAYPQLGGVRVDFEWGGKICIVPNRVPLLGRIKNNVYYCQGYSGHGVNGSHIMAEVTADALCGTMEKFDLFAGMKHLRLPGTRWMGNQIIALGMIYHRLKDLM